MQDWQKCTSGGCLFLDTDVGQIIGHQYSLRVKTDTTMWFTIEPKQIGEATTERYLWVVVGNRGLEAFTICIIFQFIGYNRIQINLCGYMNLLYFVNMLYKTNLGSLL